MPLFLSDTDYKLRLMSAVDEAEMFGDELTDEDIENMLEEMHDKYARRKLMLD